MSNPGQGDALLGAVRALYRADNIDEFVAADQQVSEWQWRALRPVAAPASDLQTGPISGRPINRPEPGVHRESRQIFRQHLDIALYRDVKSGRGSTRIHLDHGQIMSQIDSWRALIDDGAARALASLEPVWTLPRPAAPARVLVADVPLLRDPETALTSLREALEAAFAGLAERTGEPPIVARELYIVAQRIRSRVRTSHKFAHDYWATRLEVAVALAIDRPDGPVQRVRREVRRRADVDAQALVASAARLVRARSGARPLTPGRYDVILADDARTPARVSISASPFSARGGPIGQIQDRDERALGAYGWFAPLVAHADSRWARRGLTRYQPGQRLLGDRPRRGDPLTLVSDGTLRYGLYSRPIGDLGAPTRRFTIIDQGVVRGFSLSVREAAVRHTGANGGVCNLAIAAGPHSESAIMTPGERPLVRVDVLDWLHVDTHTGAFSAAIGVGFALAGPSADDPPVAITGGIMRGNVFDMWADARLSADMDTAGWYYGPRWLRFGAIIIS